MRQKVCNAKYRVVGFFADMNIHSLAVCFDYHAVNCQRNGRPLVFFYSAVIVCFEICYLGVFVERIRLQIKARAVYVAYDNVDAVVYALFADC